MAPSRDHPSSSKTRPTINVSCTHSAMCGLFVAKSAIFWTFFFSSALLCCSTPYGDISRIRLSVVNSTNNTAWKSLDTLLQAYAFRAFRRPNPKTGTIYDATPPANLSSISLAAIRLRSGSFKRYGVPQFNEFSIPTGVATSPYVERLILVYQNLMNWSSVYFNIPGYTFVAPVLGLLAYNASDLNATNLQELDVSATNQSISIHFTGLSSTMGMVPICASFYLNGTVALTNMSSANVCSTVNEGHFSLVIESLAPSPSPSPSPTPAPVPAPSLTPPSKKKSSNTWKIITASTVGGFFGLVLLIALCFGGFKYSERSRIEHMEQQAEQSVALQTAFVGGSRAPTAGGTRTQPTLETEYTAS